MILAILDEFLNYIIITIAQQLDKCHPCFLYLFDQVLIGLLELLKPAYFYCLSISAFIPLYGPQSNSVTHSNKPAISAFPPGDLTDRWPPRESRSNLLYRSPKRSAIPVELIHVHDSGDLIITCLVPHLLCLCFNASNSIQDTDDAIENPQRT